MNYLWELNCFYQQLTLTPLSVHAVALWGLLMSLSNQAGWPETIVVSDRALTGLIQVSHRTFLQARAQLVESGLIECHESLGAAAPQYVLKSLGKLSFVHLVFDLVANCITRGEF